MKTFTRDGYEIAFATKGSGPDLLFIHNGGTSSTIWRHQVADLSSRYRTIVVDLPGFGAAARPSTTAVKWQPQVNLLAGLLEELDVEKVLVVGNCMGSNLAAGLADSKPDVVQGLVLINPLTEATLTDGGLGTLRSAGRFVPWRQVGRRLVPPRLAAIATVRLQLGDKGIAKDLHHDEELLATNQRRDQLPAIIDVSDDLSAYGDLDRRVRPLPPICAIWGVQNKALSVRAGRRLNERLRPERAEFLAGCGHLPMLEDPDAVTNIIDEFAQRHLVGRPRPVETRRESADEARR